MNWQELEYSDYPKVLTLLQRVQFPHIETAGTRAMIYACLERAKSLVMKEDGEVIGWVGLADVGGNWWSFDIAIKPEWQGKWDYQERLKEIGKYVFTNLKADGIVGVCYNPASIKLGLKCGMVMTDEIEPLGGVVLKATKDQWRD